MAAHETLSEFRTLSEATGIGTTQLWRFGREPDHKEHREPAPEQKATIARALGRPIKFFEAVPELRARQPRVRRT